MTSKLSNFFSMNNFDSDTLYVKCNEIIANECSFGYYACAAGSDWMWESVASSLSCFITQWSIPMDILNEMYLTHTILDTEADASAYINLSLVFE